MSPAAPTSRSEPSASKLLGGLRADAFELAQAAIVAGPERLASSSWAHPVDRAARAGEFASLVSEAHYYGFYETQLERSN